MGQIVGLKAKPKRCNLNKLSQLGTPAAGEYILVSYDNSMTANGQGNFDRYIMGDGRTAATALELKYLDDSTRPYIVEEVNKAVADIQPIEITGDVTNAPDEEDLTSENQGGTDVLKFKDKAYNSALYSGLGRVYLRKNIVTLEGTGKNVLTQAMMNTANTIYHIQYDYDLNGQTITMPAGCVLEFDGGSLANGIIVGNNTGIIAGECQIFSFDRTQHYISGTWNIKRWNVKWFGAVGDGACTESNGNTIFAGTDNYPALQTALDTAYKCSPHSVEIPTGFYRISKGLIMNYTAYKSMEVVGTAFPSNYPEGFNGGAVLLCEGEYGIAVNRMRKAKISNITFIGLNYAFQRANNIGLNNPANGMLLPTGFIGEELGAMSESGIGRYNPYSAIVLDGFVAPATNTSYSEPTLPPYLSISSMYQSGGNSGVTIEDCNVSGFGVGISQYPSNADANGDYSKIIRCYLSYNVYGVAIGNSQSREFVISESNITNSHTAIITTLIGKQQGRIGTTINNCDFSANINIINGGAQLTATTFKNCTGELLYALGKTSVLDYNIPNVSFEDCYFKLGRPYFSDDDLGVPVYLFEGPVNMRNVRIDYEDDGHSEKRIGAINLVSIRVRCNIENVKCFAFTASATNRGSYEPPLVVYGNNFNSFYPHNAYGNFKSEMWATYQQEKMWFSFPAPIYTRAGSFTFTDFNATDGTLVMPSNSKVTEMAVGDVVVCSAFAGIIIRIESNGSYAVRLTNGFKKKNGVYSLINDNGSVAATPMYMLSRKRYLTLSENYYLRVATHPSDNVITLDHWSNDLAVGMTLFYAEQLPNSIRQDTGALPYITALDSTTKQVTFNRRVSCYAGDYVMSYLCKSDDASVTGFINYMLVSGVKA